MVAYALNMALLAVEVRKPGPAAVVLLRIHMYMEYLQPTTMEYFAKL